MPCVTAECAEREPLVAHLARMPGGRALSKGDALAFEKSLHRCRPRAFRVYS